MHLIECKDNPGASYRPAGVVMSFEEAVRYVNRKNQEGMSRGAFYRAIPIHVLEDAK